MQGWKYTVDKVGFGRRDSIRFGSRGRLPHCEWRFICVMWYHRIKLCKKESLGASHGRYNLTIQSMIKFCLKMIQFNFWFKRKLSKMIQFNFQFKRKLSGFNSKKIFNQKKNPGFNSKKYSIQNYSWPIQFNNIFNSKLFLANSIQWNIQ